MTYINLVSTANHYVPGKIAVSDVSQSKFEDLVGLETVPLFVDGSLVWTDEFDPS